MFLPFFSVAIERYEVRRFNKFVKFGFGAKGRRCRLLFRRSEIVFGQKLITFLDENLLAIKFFRVFYEIAKTRGSRDCFGSKAASEAVNKIMGGDRLAVAPFRVVPQMKDKFIDMRACFPALGERRYRLLIFRAVFDQALIKGHKNAGLGLAVGQLWVESFGLGT